MNKRFIISVIIGTLILFIWNAISWMALPFHSNTLINMPENTVNTETLKSNLGKDGVYHYPGYPEDDSEATMKKVEDQLQTGPRITMMVYKNGSTSLFDPLQFVKSLIINLLTVLFTLLVISKLKFQTLKEILIACFLIGIVSVLVSDLSLMNWYMFPLDYTLVNVFDKVVGFCLLGLLFGYFTFREKISVI